MEKEHFVETERCSLFGDYLYDQIVPENHFLRILKQQIPWEHFNQALDQALQRWRNVWSSAL